MKFLVLCALASCTLLTANAAKKVKIDNANIIAEAAQAFKNDDLSKALKLYNQVVANDPQNGVAWASIAAIYEQAENTEKGFDAARKALAALPATDSANLAWVHYTMAKMYILEGDSAAIVDHLDRTVELQPLDMEYKTDRAMTNLILGNLDGAESMYKEILKQAPENEDAMLKMSMIASERGNTYGAIEWLDKLIKLNPNNADAYANRAIEYYNLEMINDAVDDMIRSFEVEPGNELAVKVMSFVTQNGCTLLKTRVAEKAQTSRDSIWSRLLEELNAIPLAE